MSKTDTTQDDFEQHLQTISKELAEKIDSDASEYFAEHMNASLHDSAHFVHCAAMASVNRIVQADFFMCAQAEGIFKIEHMQTYKVLIDNIFLQAANNIKDANEYVFSLATKDVTKQ